MDIQIISCKKCKKDYLMGIDGKDIREAKTSGGRTEGVPFMAIGNDEIEKSEELNLKEIECKRCGDLCKVKILGSK